MEDLMRLHRQYTEVERDTLDLKEYAISNRDAMAAGPISGNVLIELHEKLVSLHGKITAAKNTAGMGDFVARLFPGSDVATYWNNILTEIADVGSYFVTNSTAIVGTSWIAFTANGVNTKSFASSGVGGTATLRGLLDDLITAIAVQSN